MGDYYHPAVSLSFSFFFFSNPHVISHPIQFDRAKLGDIFFLPPHNAQQPLSLYIYIDRGDKVTKNSLSSSLAHSWFLPQLAWFIWTEGWPIHANVINRLAQMEVLCFSQHKQNEQEKKREPKAKRKKKKREPRVTPPLSRKTAPQSI